MENNSLEEEVKNLRCRMITELQASHEARMQLDKALDALWKVAKLGGKSADIAKLSIFQLTGEEP